MKFSVTHRIEENVETPGGVIDILKFEVKFDNGNLRNFKYEFLSRDVDYITGNYPYRKFSSYSQTREKKLSLASSNVWQVGWYLPTHKFGNSPSYHDITKHILDNKHPVEDYIPYLLALSMYVKAKKENFDIFDANSIVIVPVPNFGLDDNTGAVSISKELRKIMIENGANVLDYENLLKKTIDKEAKHMKVDEKEEFYSKNKLYEFNKKYSGISLLRGKKVILVDDVITHGYAAEQCLKELSNQGADDLCFYSVATTKA